MRVATNLASLSVLRNERTVTNALHTSFKRLSSGFRINSAKDDAAGLAISEGMRNRIRSNHQLIRNASDGLSLLQVADGALATISDILVRGRELAMSASNGTLSTTDRNALQQEFSALLSEIDRTAAGASFNGKDLLGGGQPAPPVVLESETTNSEEAAARNGPILDNLKRSFLAQSETLVQTHYGINGQGANFSVVLENAIGGASAYVTGSSTDVELHIDVSEFEQVGNEWPNDTLDNLIAHEMTHAVMLASTNLYSFEKWFAEGTAEFLPGGDLRVDMLDGQLDGETIDKGQIVSHIDGIRNNWSASHLDYATAYVATRYLHDVAGGGGIRDVLGYLSADAERTLDDYFADQAPGGIGTVDDFVASFKSNGVAFMDARINLANTTSDIGGIGGGDADGGSRDASLAGAVPDVDAASDNPLATFNETFPDPAASTDATAIELPVTEIVNLVIGEGQLDIIQVGLPSASSGSLGLGGANIAQSALSALGKIDAAQTALSQARANIGAQQNRLVVAMGVLDTETLNVTAAESRIRDVDVASESAELSRNQILQQSLVSTLAQAKQIPSLMLQLL